MVKKITRLIIIILLVISFVTSYNELNSVNFE